MRFNEYEELNNVLKILNIEISLNHLHGLFCAFHSYPSPIDFENWRLKSPANKVSTLNTIIAAQKAVGFLKRFYNDTKQNLERNKFEPLLYQDTIASPHHFAQAGEWASGYYEGIKANPEWENIISKDEKIREVLAELALFTGAEKLVKDENIRNNPTTEKEVFRRLEEFNEIFYNIGIANRKMSRYQIN